MSDTAADAASVNVHLNYTNTVYDTHFDDIIKPRLIELGIRHIRTTPSIYSNIQARYIDLANNGIKSLIVNRQYSDEAIVKTLNSSGVQVVDAVEPPNEVDANWGTTWPQQMMDYMKQMWSHYKTDPALANITILGPSFANTRDSAAQLAAVFPDVVNYMDVGNVHDYSGTAPEVPLGGGWGMSLDLALQKYTALSGSKPIWASENGYKMSGSDSQKAVTQRAAAKYVPRQILSHLQRGATRWSEYQLINDNTNNNYGILNDDGTPRLQYTSLKNFIAMFKDPGATFTPGMLDYSLTGDLTNIQKMLFQKRDGKFYLVVWQGVNSSSGTTDDTLADIDPTPRALTLTLTTKIYNAKTYTPSFSSAAINTYQNSTGITSISLSVPDHILVIELDPTAPASSDTQAPSVPQELTATTISNSQINLAWATSTDNVGVAGYRIYKNGVQIGTSTTPAFSVMGLPAGTPYTFTVDAYDAAGNTSTKSAGVLCATQSNTAPPFRFSVGSGVQTTDVLNVRAKPLTTGTLLGTQPLNAIGVVVGGPTIANGYTWWNIDFNSGVDGWSVDDYLAAYSNIPTPTLTLSASPTSITSGQSATLSWSSTNTTSCSASGGWSGTKAISGTQAVTPTQTTTYAVTCTGTGGSATQSTTVTVSAVTPPPTMGIGARVKTTATVNVRTKPTTNPSGKVAGQQTAGKLGTVVGGPQSANGYMWWNINFDSGADGWVAGEYLTTSLALEGDTASLAASVEQSSTFAELKQQITNLLSIIETLSARLQAATAALGR